MTARESIHGKLNKLRQQSKQTGQIQLSASALTLWAEAGIHLLLAAVLAGAVIFEGYSPFGVALVGAAGSGLCGGAALLGACFGYLCQMGFADGLRYASASILTFAVAFAFYDLKAIPSLLDHAAAHRRYQRGGGFYLSVPTGMEDS